MRKFKYLLFAFAIAFSGMLGVNAATGMPEKLVVGAETVFFANGHEITITAPTTAGMGATVTWDGGSMELPSDAWVFGGTHNNSTDMVNSKITMNGGQLYAIVGGGLHASKVNTAAITINNGTLKSVYGGGVASIFFDAPTTEEKSHDYNGDAKVSTTSVEKATITINNGTLTKYIYGGGMGYNYTGETTIIVNGGDQSSAILTAGGANGYTGNATVVFNDGKLGIYQSVNRGTVDDTQTEVNGGTIDQVYLGGQSTDSSVTGTVGNVDMTITGGNVTNVEVGTNGVDDNKQSITAKENVTLTYNKDTVTNIDETQFREEAIEKTVKITFVYNGEEVTEEIPYGTKFSAEDLNGIKLEINKEIEKEGLRFDDFYADEALTKKFDMTGEFTEDTTVYIKTVEFREDDGTKNPETADIGIFSAMLAIILGAVGFGFTLKKRKFN